MLFVGTSIIHPSTEGVFLLCNILDLLIYSLEKVADYITFIHQGKVLFCKTKDELRYNYGIIRCGAALFDQLDKAEILAYRKDDYQWNVLVADKEKARRKYKNAVVDDATIDDILLLYVKGEQAK